jgi:hypothetical protein
MSFDSNNNNLNRQAHGFSKLNAFNNLNQGFINHNIQPQPFYNSNAPPVKVNYSPGDYQNPYYQQQQQQSLSPSHQTKSRIKLKLIIYYISAYLFLFQIIVELGFRDCNK